MTRYGIKVALEHAEMLPSFPSLEAAEKALFQLRDQLRDMIQDLSRRCGITLDYSPESLKILERWHFELCSSNGFKKLGVTQEVFERCVGFYIGHIYTENDPDFKWIVEENPYKTGKYQIGVRKGLCTIMLGRISLRKRDNKRMQSMYRDYKQYSQI